MDDRTLALLGDRAAQERITERGELLECPHCNAPAMMLKMRGLKRFFFNPTVKRPTCTKCGATVFVWLDEKDAIRRWNHRAPLLTENQLALLGIAWEPRKFEEEIK